MGGGGVMRAAAKVAGIGAVNSGLRGFPGLPPVENSVATSARQARRPVSAIVSSSEDVNSVVMIASQNDKLDASIQRPCWELDDWEFAGGENESILQSSEPFPRLVFGGVPTIEETKEATSELKEALEMVYLSSPNSTESKGSFITGQESGLSFHSDVDSNDCVTSQNWATPVVSTHAISAFRFLNESPVAQTVVASIACDQNVWHAVLNNPALVEYLESQKTSNVNTVEENEPSAEAVFQDPAAPKSFGPSSESSSQSNNLGDSFSGFLENVKINLEKAKVNLENAKVKVMKMVSNLSDRVQDHIFGVPPSEKSDGTADEDGKNSSFLDKAMSGGFVGLAIMVIMLVVLKRN